MKIVNKYVASTKIAELKEGDVFQVENDSKFYMKIHEVMDMDADDLNTICLNTTKLYSLSDRLDIFPIDCELIIK